MAFIANNGRKIKSVKPGRDFPILQNGKIVAMLVSDESSSDVIMVHIVKKGEVLVRIEGREQFYERDITIEGRCFEIHSQKNDNAILVRYAKEAGQLRLTG